MQEDLLEEVPGFVVEKLNGREPDELRRIADYLESQDSGDDVPDFVVGAAALQEDETLDAMIRFTRELIDNGGSMDLNLGSDEGDEDDEDDEDPRNGNVALSG